MLYNIVSHGTEANVTAFIDGEMFVADNEHPNWQEIVTSLAAGDKNVVNLFDVAKAISTKFEHVSERVTVNSGHVYFDGEEIDNTLTQAILRALDEQADLKPLANFFENIMLNPNEHSREQLYRWLAAHNFTINHDGHIVGYKGVKTLDDGTHTSISHGTATVNGQVHTGAIPYAPGDVVEMPRGDVQFDPSVGCHTGLHVGTWDYAKGFGHGNTMTVVVNPRDVVSVPTDCRDAKMRVCRYVISTVVENPHNKLVVDHRQAEKPRVVVGPQRDKHGHFLPKSGNATYSAPKRDAQGRFIS